MKRKFICEICGNEITMESPACCPHCGNSAHLVPDNEYVKEVYEDIFKMKCPWYDEDYNKVEVFNRNYMDYEDHMILTYLKENKNTMPLRKFFLLKDIFSEYYLYIGKHGAIWLRELLDEAIDFLPNGLEIYLYWQQVASDMNDYEGSIALSSYYLQRTNVEKHNDLGKARNYAILAYNQANDYLNEKTRNTLINAYIDGTDEDIDYVKTIIIDSMKKDDDLYENQPLETIEKYENTKKELLKAIIEDIDNIREFYLKSKK